MVMCAGSKRDVYIYHHNVVVTNLSLRKNFRLRTIKRLDDATDEDIPIIVTRCAKDHLRAQEEQRGALQGLTPNQKKRTIYTLFCDDMVTDTVFTPLEGQTVLGTFILLRKPKLVSRDMIRFVKSYFSRNELVRDCINKFYDNERNVNSS
ncbi:uncharacterized protein LOC128554762 [Mercenaria mercenaria]|uniref:uncharacterized protein LOC128554762 n=1 Tax=Mercenaria mercenaria TaxID=6596 RepID=UPI00234EE8C3|nr:uncharacterized protein LOC128554762 [Mercenaria mercenaria]